jgi:alcohol dehydrogenase YqhD (iron-dependent ADH family)
VGAAIAASAGREQVSVWDFTSGGPQGRQEVKKTLPTLLVTSTAATGTEGNCAAVVTKWSTREKAAMWSPGCFPAISIVDPEMMLSLPLSATRDGAVDMIMHVLETYFAGHDKSSLQDSITEGLVRGVMENLDRVEKNPQDLTARENLSWGSIAALLGGGPNLGRSGGFVVHQMEHPLSGYKDISHGSGLAALWPRYMRLIAEKRSAKIARFGNTCLGVSGSGDGAAAKTLDEIESWLKKHEMWFTLKDFGVQASEIGAMTDQALAISGGGREFLEGPMPINRERITKIYQDTLN